MATDLGKISQTTEGIYNPSTIYERLDTVRTQGGSYISKIDNNNQPLSNLNAWQVSALDGIDGIDGVDGINGTNAQSFNFKDNINNYSELPSIGNIINDAYYNLDDNLLYVYNGDSFPIEGEGINIQGSTEIEDWVAGNYVEKSLTIKDNLIWRVTDGQTATIADVPGVSDKWEVLYANKINRSELFPLSKNLFNKNSVIEGKYISAGSGNILDDPNTSVSAWIPIQENETYYLSGRNQDFGNTLAFRDNLGNNLTALSSPGGSANPDYNFSKNGVIYSPPNAVEIAFTVRFVNTGTYDSIQLELGPAQTSYESYGQSSVISSDKLGLETISLNPNSTTKPVSGKVVADYVSTYLEATVDKPSMRAKRVGDELYVAMPYTETLEIVEALNVFRNSSTDEANNNVNFLSEQTIVKGGNIASTLEFIKFSGDDTTPNRINGLLIDGNHGWSGVFFNVLKTNHGKTFSNIGNIGVDSNGVQFVITKINNANSFCIICRNRATDGYSYSFSIPVGDLTFNGNLMTGISYDVVNNEFEFTKSVSRRILINGNSDLVDGQEIACNTLDIHDVHDIYDLSSVIERLILTSGSYTANPVYTDIGADKLYRTNLLYRFVNNVCLMSQTISSFKKLTLDYFGALQMGALDTGSLYINKVLPIAVGSTTYDFRTNPIWTVPSSLIDFPKSTWENINNTPDRWIQTNGNHIIGMGFIKNIGFDRSTNAKAGYLNTTRKIYPYAVLDKSMEENESYSVLSYRTYQNRTTYPLARVSKVEFYNNGDYYLILDWNDSITDSISLPKETFGKNIEIVEKTDNVKVLSTVASSQIDFNVLVDSSNVYGYCVLKIKN